jgi:hypothetical protein
MNTSSIPTESSASSSSSSNRHLPITFDAVIIDEAAQAVEPSTIIPFKYNPKVPHRTAHESQRLTPSLQMVILVGDPKQLCAVVQSPNTSRCGYGQSLFEVQNLPISFPCFTPLSLSLPPSQRMHRAGYPMLMLDTQYRMHPQISYFPSQEFYHGKLTNDPLMIPTRGKGNQNMVRGSHWKPYHDDPSRRYAPLVWHDFYSGQQELVGTSYRNQQEVHQDAPSSHSWNR